MADSTSIIDSISQSQAQKEVTANANFDAGSPSMAFGRHASACAGLTWGFYGGVVFVSGTPTAVDNGTVTLTDDDTNYVYADSSGVVHVTTSSPSGWPGPLAASAVALYEVTTADGFVESYIDWRTAQGAGLVGAQGPQGAQGSAGSTGAQGSAGPQGTTGAQGPQGTGGGAGSQGSTGAQGPQGTQGTQGTQGPTATESLLVACSDESTALTSGTGKVTFRMPYAFTLTAVRASLATAQASGSIFTVDINESGTTVLSTKLTIDNTEKTSQTAATAPVISDSSIADDSEITVDIDQIGDGTAKGLKITLIGHQ